MKEETINAPLTQHVDQELINKVVNWFEVRNLNNGNPFAQYNKLREETEEILYSLRLKKDGTDTTTDYETLRAEFLDGVGDTLVVIIGILLQTSHRNGFDGVTLHPILLHEDKEDRIRNHFIEVSNGYTKHLMGVDKRYAELYITHAVDDIRSRTSAYIFNDKRDVNEKTLVYYTSIMVNALNDIINMGAVYFDDETIKENTLTDCLELAYNEIKDRKGLLNDEGEFVKEENLNEEQRKKLEDLLKAQK